MKIIIVIIICAFSLTFQGRAQINFVKNPSFEQYSLCPNYYDEAKYCNFWISIDTAWNPPDWAHCKNGVPEYCNICATDYKVSVPYNTRFYHYPRTGDGMMQMQMYFNSADTAYSRDYLQQHFSQTLFAGHQYNVCFYAVLERASHVAVNNLGVYFDDGTIDTTRYPSWTQSQYAPQIVDTNIINDTLNWIKIEGTFFANGTEKFMTIGNFSNRSHTDTTIASPYSTFAISWYLIDDVSVIDCSNIPNAGHDTLITLGDSVFIGSHELLLPYTWYVAGNTTPIDSGGGFWAHPTTATTYVLEQDLCGMKKWDTVKVWVAPVGVSILQNAVSNLQLYPNPATSEITIEHAANCEAAFYDVMGRKVASFVSMTNKEVLDISALVNGVYLVQVTDGSTGARAVKTMLKE